MRDALLDAATAVRQAKEDGGRALAPACVQRLVDRYWQAVREGLSFHRGLPAFDPSPHPKKRKKQRPDHNLLIRFKTFKDETLRFLADFDAPFTNNLTEQDEGLGLLPNLRTRRSFHHPPLRRLDSQKAGHNILKTLAANPHHLAKALND